MMPPSVISTKGGYLCSKTTKRVKGISWALVPCRSIHRRSLRALIETRKCDRVSKTRKRKDEKPMDISFKLDDGKFNYRVCAVMISDGKLLTMRDDRSPYSYLPGGRVALGETAENAVLREVREELGVVPKIIRPLWLNQAFFTEDVDHLRYHELCIYFLMDISETDLLSRGERFTANEGERVHSFEWMAFERLQEAYFYPLFLKKEISDLPDVFTIRTEIE